MERNNLSKLKSVFKGIFLKLTETNVRMLRTRIMHFNFSGLKYFFSLALNNNKQTYMKTVENKYIMIRSSSFLKCSIKTALF